ncbi:MAG: transcription antitermination factor NusB [Chloroflexi bacterium]|nr:transcription antitermination factor NusB [Chloroflexota bacterium]
MVTPMERVNFTDQRRLARTAALQSLFAADVRSTWSSPNFEWLDEEEELPESSVEFARRLLTGVAKSHSGLDNVITRYAPAWPVSQLSLIDRNILRIALFELIYTPETPRKTAINEAVELAKIFGSDSSARFVNGVLGSAMSGLESGEIAPIESVL